MRANLLKAWTLNRFPLNRRQRLVILSAFIFIFIVAIWFSGIFIHSNSLATQLTTRNIAPSLEHLFGTDWLGRDMFVRTIKGLGLSIQVGLAASICSCLIATLIGVAASMGRKMDSLISWLIDLFLSVPHLVSLILISFVFGGGIKGIIIGIALTHWPSLARVIRAEVLQLKSTEYVLISKRLGKSSWWVATRHILPHIVPQVLVGLLLLFPHAILHEAAITFLGLGLSPHQPAIGIILSESMLYISTGMWWLAFFPGVCLLLTVRSFDVLGENLRTLWDPHRSQL